MPADDLAACRQLVTLMEDGELRLSHRGVDDTTDEIAVLTREIAHLEVCRARVMRDKGHFGPVTFTKPRGTGCGSRVEILITRRYPVIGA